MIVAPPSGNTSFDPYQVLHIGFDTLTVAVKANLPPDVTAYFETQRTLAETEQREVLINWEGGELLLKGHGGAGYRFLATGGPLGASWAFKKPNSKDPWGLRVTFGSMFLATYGLGAARGHLDRVLERFGIRTQASDFSMSRVDVCCDVLAPGFQLVPENFVMHSSTNRRDHHDAALAVNGKSGKITSVTVGSVARRQVILYNKRLEVIQKHKPYWWTIWNKTRSSQGLPPLDPKNPNAMVWRAEFRAGKKLLKDVWNIRTWEDLFARFGDLIAQTGDVIRYTDPPLNDSNRARWPTHPLWETICAEFAADLFEMREGADPNPVKMVNRAQHVSVLAKNARGVLTSLAAVKGVEYGQLPSFFDDMADEFKGDLRTSPDHMSKMYANACDRYHFIE